MESVEGRLEKRGFENDAKVWTGKEMVKMLADEPSLRLTTFSLTLYKVCNAMASLEIIVYADFSLRLEMTK